MSKASVRVININDTDQFTKKYVGSLILTHDRQILLQQRDENIQHFPGYLSEFGGKIEANETPIVAIIRELKEELGANIESKELTFLGAISESLSQYQELVYCYFWYDKSHKITGCYEGKPLFFNDLKQILIHPKIMASTIWMLNECKRKDFL